MNKILLFSGLWLFVPMIAVHADLSKPTEALPVVGVVANQNLQASQNQNLPPAIQLKPITITKKQVKRVEYSKNQDTSKYAGFLSRVSSDYNVKKKVVLVKAQTTRNKEAIMFVFLMNKPKPVVTEATEKLVKNNGRKKMHIMWTGSRKTLQEQKVIENEYPVDVSIDNYSEGYAQDEWNLILPNKKPKEVMVGLLWAF